MQNITKNLGQFIFRTSVFSDLFFGTCTCALISTLVYPVNVTKTHMILVIGGKHLSFLTVFSDLMQKCGLKRMFTSVHVNYSRYFLLCGIINYFYEVIHVRLSLLDYYYHSMWYYDIYCLFLFVKISSGKKCKI